MPKPTLLPDAPPSAGMTDADMISELRIIRTMLAALYIVRAEKYAARTRGPDWGAVIRGTVALQYFDNWSHNDRAQCYAFCATFGPSQLLDAICSRAIEKEPAFRLFVENAMM